MALILGGFTFTDYAIPQNVPQGGEQQLIIHKLPGGSRVIDALGPDDANISWSGRFQGVGALQKAIALDQLRKGGQQVPLIVDSQFYSVVVHKFEFDYQRSYQILYKITCVVVSSAGGSVSAITPLDTLVSQDMAASSAATAEFSGNAVGSAGQFG